MHGTNRNILISIALASQLGRLCRAVWILGVLTVCAGGHVCSIGAKHTCEPKVRELADIAARVLLCGLDVLDEHIGALQVTAQ